MQIENLSTLKIHKLTKEQYERELEAGRIDENALYLTPDDGIGISGYAWEQYEASHPLYKYTYNVLVSTAYAYYRYETEHDYMVGNYSEGPIYLVNDSYPTDGTEASDGYYYTVDYNDCKLFYEDIQGESSAYYEVGGQGELGTVKARELISKGTKGEFTGIYIVNEDSSYLPEYGYNEADGYWYVRINKLNLENGESEGSIVGKTSKAVGKRSFAFGKNNIAGQMAYYILSIDQAKKRIYLSDATLRENVVPEFSDADNTNTAFETPLFNNNVDFSIRNGKHHDFCGKIVSVSNNVITYAGEIPFDSFEPDGTNQVTQNSDDQTFFVPSQPDIGLISINGIAFAEGGYNIASGAFSHAEGVENIAAGNYSHAEGYGTITGYLSHAEGDATKAVSRFSHTEGQYTETHADRSHAEGIASKTYGAGSHAEGTSTQTQGHSSHSEGSYTKAEGDYSHSEGSKSQAIGVGSHAEGETTISGGTASHTEGGNTKTEGNYSHAEGYKTTAIGDYSHAEGELNVSTGVGAHSEGKNNNAYGKYSHAEGSETEAIGDYSHAEGYDTTASGVHSHAEGQYSKANGFISHAEGYLSKADGDYSHAEGYDTKATGLRAHAEGCQTIASGKHAHAEGYQTESEGSHAHAEGIYSKAKGWVSHAEGFGTVTGANSDAQHVQGRYNIINDNYNGFADIVGNGTSDTNRSNAYTLDWKGNGRFAGSVYVGGTLTSDENIKKLATEDYVDTKVASMIDSAPETLDTLSELAEALGNDQNFATTVTNQIASKANKATTLEGYGITDAYTKAEVDTMVTNSGSGLTITEYTDTLSAGDWTRDYLGRYTYEYYTSISYYIDLDNDSPDNYTIIFDIAANATLEQRKAAESACLYGEFRDMADNSGSGNVWRHEFIIGCTSDSAPTVDIPIDVVVMK